MWGKIFLNCTYTCQYTSISILEQIAVHEMIKYIQESTSSGFIPMVTFHKDVTPDWCIFSIFSSEVVPFQKFEDAIERILQIFALILRLKEKEKRTGSKMAKMAIHFKSQTGL